MGAIATGGLYPDLTIILDVPTPTARARIGEARDRIEDRPDDYHVRVRAGFMSVAEESQFGRCVSYPAPIAVIDASSDVETVARRIRNGVERVLAVDPRG